MTAIAQEILNNFDRLPSTEQMAIALAILRRLENFDFPQLTDEDLALNAEELFLALDQQEVDIDARFGDI
jgi:DNA-binding transcriptional regulator YhcF (GntR family)